MNNKQTLSEIIKSETVKSLIAHAELYGNLPTSGVDLLAKEITARNQADRKIDIKAERKSSTPPVVTFSEQKIEPKESMPKQELPKPIITDSKLVSDLAELKKEVVQCTACSLYKTRKQIVFGEGCNQIPLVCIGEAPGEEEDKSGLPFVGKAGQLLTKMLEAINVDRNNIYICNVLKCRPPMNRDPNSDEVSSCSGYLDRQLAILKPRYILALGRIAAKRLLKLDYTMAQFRTQMHEYNGIPVLVTYHPSALLRNPNWKQPAWEDLQKLQKLLDL